MSAKISGLKKANKLAFFQFVGWYLDKGAWEGKPLTVGDLPETEATMQKGKLAGELPEEREWWGGACVSS